MGLISDFEERLGGAIEGAFAGMFKSPVQPAELARACGKEMARSKKLGVGKVYVSNVYSIILSTRDHGALAGLIPTLQGELETYLLAYSREHDFQMATRPIVRFYPAPDLKLGRFEVIGDMLSVDEIEAELGSVPGVTPEREPEPAAAPASPAAAVASAAPFGEGAISAPGFDSAGLSPDPAAIAAPGFGDLDIDPEQAAPDPEDLNMENTPRVRPGPRLRHDFDLPSVTADDRSAASALAPASAPAMGAPIPVPVPAPVPASVPTPAPAPEQEIKAWLTLDNFGPLSLKGKRSVSIGRQDDNDLVIADANASRHHARLECEDGDWMVVDLGATNGTLLNNARTQRSRLRDGDVVTIGITKIQYHEKVALL
ncbi:MAG: DUF3662 domain-containing protein [Coriobacteriia bacterium]|nr:DUF3662 domain-containing protein [Coriobacteriia bacterium]